MFCCVLFWEFCGVVSSDPVADDRLGGFSDPFIRLHLLELLLAPTKASVLKNMIQDTDGQPYTEIYQQDLGGSQCRTSVPVELRISSPLVFQLPILSFQTPCFWDFIEFPSLLMDRSWENSKFLIMHHSSCTQPQI